MLIEVEKPSAQYLALVENLSGILAMMEGDGIAAEQAFQRAGTLSPEQVPDSR